MFVPTEHAGYVVIGRAPGDNAYCGVVEHSFHMDTSKDRVCFFWTGTADSILGQFQIDGYEDARHYLEHFSKTRPDMKFEVHDVHSPECPVVVDLDAWYNAQGCGNKFNKRNMPFTMRAEPPREHSQCP